MTRDAEVRRVALHEAAHAVVGDALGWRIRTVVATPGGGRLGFCEHHRREDLSPMALAVDDVTILAAGWIGEMLEPMSGYFAPVDDDDAAIALAVNEALEALPPDDAGFVFSVLTDTRPLDGDDETRQQAIALAVVAHESAVEERGLFLAFCRARATRLVCAHVPAILALAEELLRRPILDGPAAEAVIRGAVPERPSAALGRCEHRRASSARATGACARQPLTPVLRRSGVEVLKRRSYMCPATRPASPPSTP